MKKILSMVMTLLMAGMVYAQEPVIRFDRTTHDFGKILEADGRVTTVFTFRNEGMSPLVLSNVRASCGCTTPKWTKEPIEPGQEGEITVTYNPNGRPGMFQKTITVTSNAKEATSKLFIKGEVIPKSVKPVDMFPVKMGNLSLAKKELDFGEIKKGTTSALTLGYANQTEETFTLACATSADYIFAYPSKDGEKVTLDVTKQMKGELQVIFDADYCPTYGPVNQTVYMIINGQENKEYAIDIHANIVEDFSQMSEEEMNNAPIIGVEKEIDLGSFKKGKKGKHSFSMSNGGINQLLVRRIVNGNSQLSFNAPKSVRSGKKANVQVTVKADEAGTFIAPVTIITNDPKKPVEQVMLRWTVTE